MPNSWNVIKEIVLNLQYCQTFQGFKLIEIRPIKKSVTRKALEALVLREAAGEWGCEDITGVTIEYCDPGIFGRNWTVTHLQNEDLPAGERTVRKIVERLGQLYDLQSDQSI